MDRLELLKSLSFGAQVAEEETSELASYFVETDQWLRIFKGEVDVVRGHKGAGKSAIYSLLTTRTDEFFDKRILLVTGERPRGATVFKDLAADPPTSEAQFVGLWKLYIAAIIAQQMEEYGVEAKEFYAKLRAQGLLEPKADLGRIFRSVRDYAKSWLAPASVEGKLDVNAAAGIFSVGGKIVPSEPSSEEVKAGILSVDRLLELGNTALEKSGYRVWVLLDRLDVAFAETHALERNALRALFRVYLDMAALNAVSLKIFLRSDIWDRIVEGGFREASHITRVAVLEWTPAALLNLMIRRLIKNKTLVQQYGIDAKAVLSDFKAQNALFYQLLPDQVEQGSRRPKTFDWMLSRCADASRKTAPRELIHLLISMREQEIARLERGESVPPDEQLFDRTVFKAALPAVSEARLVQNLYAEYPELKPYVSSLTGEKTEQTPDSLATLWKLKAPELEKTIQRAIEIGFFEARGSKEMPTYWVPFVFRDALKMSQGLADEA